MPWAWISIRWGPGRALPGDPTVAEPPQNDKRAHRQQKCCQLLRGRAGVGKAVFSQPQGPVLEALTSPSARQEAGIPDPRKKQTREMALAGAAAALLLEASGSRNLDGVPVPVTVLG